jgi:peptide/nickel transport system ATP-binding protein
MLETHMTTPIETRKIYRRFSVNSGAFGASRQLTAVADLSISLQAGETLGIAGETGCGKSTLARIIMGLTPPSSGEVLYHGTPLNKMSREEMSGFRRSVQMIFQDPFSSLNPRMRVSDIIGEPLVIHKMASGKALQERVSDLMDQTGLSSDLRHRYPHEFSGGQRQRIGIARALAVGPKVLIADEPVSALDLSIQAQIINLLMDLKSSYNLAFIFIAHDLSVVRHVSDRIAIMYLGRIVEIGSRDDIFSSFLHPYTEALISAIPRIRPDGGPARIMLAGDLPSPLEIPEGCPFNSRCRYAKSPCNRELPNLEEKSPGHWAACHYSNDIFS